MIAVIYDGLIRRRVGFLIFLLIGIGLISLVSVKQKDALIFLYILLCFYYNGFIKGLGQGVQWKLMWSLPLKDRQILGGMAVSMILLGLAMNGLLWLVARIWSDLPILLFVLASVITLITDLVTIGMQLITKKAIAGVVVVGWMVIVYGMPLFIKRPQLEAIAQRFFSWPQWMQIVPFVAAYLIGLLILRQVYQRFKRKYDLTQIVI